MRFPAGPFHAPPLVWALVLAGPFGQTGAFPAHADRLVVFVSSGDSSVARSFRDEDLAAIRKIAEQEHAELVVHDVRRGAPEEITFTPTIVFIGTTGRAVYRGRYTTVERIRRFIRTARVFPADKQPVIRRDLPVMTLGRARVAASIKIAPLTGSIPDGFDQTAFVRRMRASLLAGFRRLKRQDTVSLRTTDRLFYMDVYPWRGDDGTLFLSLALYSPFHCEMPVYRQEGEKLRGPWRDRNRLFREAGRRLEDALLETIRSPAHGDGFDPIDTDVPVRSWKELGLDLPTEKHAPQTRRKPDADDLAALPRSWRLEEQDPQSAALRFRFPAPLDAYFGEVLRVRGTIRLGTGGSLSQTNGSFEADPASVTTGEPDLDAALRGTSFLDTDRFPVSSFVFETVQPDDPQRTRIVFGEVVPATMVGRFTLKGTTIPLRSPATWEAAIGGDGQPVLWIRGRFRIRLTPFAIQGPDGPAPANDTLLFSYTFRLVPNEASHPSPGEPRPK